MIKQIDLDHKNNKKFQLKYDYLWVKKRGRRISGARYKKGIPVSYNNDFIYVNKKLENNVVSYDDNENDIYGREYMKYLEENLKWKY